MAEVVFRAAQKTTPANLTPETCGTDAWVQQQCVQACADVVYLPGGPCCQQAWRLRVWSCWQLECVPAWVWMRLGHGSSGYALEASGGWVLGNSSVRGAL